jgi:chaperonin GroEL
MIDDTVLNIITQNVLRNPFRWAVMEAPGFGKEQLEMLKDIAAFTGGRIGAVKEGLPIQEFVSGDCGKVEKVILYKDRSVFIGGAGKDVAKRISQIKSEVGQSEHTYENELREARIARLKGGVAKVFVGGKSEVEIKEKTHRMDDALYAVKSALAEGVIVGGGTGLVRAYKSMDDGFLEGLSGEELQGALIVREALKAPIMTIADNAGASGEVVFEKVLEMKGSKGYDAMQGEYKDLKKAGILDPYKVARVSLENAASIAGMVLTMNCAVIYGEGDVENMKSYM